MMKMTKAAVVSVALVGVMLEGAVAGELTLAEGGVAKATIAISAKPTKTARFAAQELKLHLDGITGGDFQVVEDAAVAGGVELRGASGKIAFRGAEKEEYGKIDAKWLPKLFDKQEPLYAVYDFLERECGVRWIDPSVVGTVLPKKPTLKVDDGFAVKRPFMEYRGGAPLDRDAYQPLTWKRNSDGEKRYNELAYGTKDGATIRRAQSLFMRRKRLGGEFKPANHSFYYWYDRYWAVNPKASKHMQARFEKHRPDLFAKGYEGQPPQLCYTNPETKEQLLEDIGRYFSDADFRKKYFGDVNGGFIWGENTFCLEPMDNLSMCTCERCSKLYEPNRAKESSQHSTYWFTFVNEIAKEVKKRYPGRQISTLAYMSHMGLPTGVKLEDNVLVYFCFGNRVVYATGNIEQGLKLMSDWRAAYPNQPLAMWHYDCFPMEIAWNGGFHCFPGHFAHSADRQYKFFAEKNISAGLFHCGFNGNVDNYVQMALMLDPTRTADELLGEYFGAFGKAGEPLRKFYETVEERYSNPKNYPPKTYHQNVDVAWKVLGTKEVMDRLGALMAEAEKLAGTEEEKTRVELFRRDVYDYMKEGYDTYVLRATAPVPHWTAVRVAAANGDADKVDWKSVPTDDRQLYVRGSDVKFPIREEVRWAHDDTHLYLEITEHVNPEKLYVAPAINPCDVWELSLALQKAQPYRYIITGCDGRTRGLSYGEVNWRQAVPASESGDESYGVRAKTDRTQKDRWTARWSFPLDTMLNGKVAPGDTIYFLGVRVIHNDVLKDVVAKNPFPDWYQHWMFGIYALVSHTTVKTCDRWAEVKLEK